MITVVIPSFNDGPRLQRLLPELPAGDERTEVIVVDGGSTDSTRDHVSAHSHVAWISAKKGRAEQMNAGARSASGDILLFIHSDSRMPEGWVDAVEAAVRNPAFSFGAFRFALDDDGLQARVVERGVRFRSKYLGLPYGDQGLFIRANDFEKSGGFPVVPIMEDVLLVRALKRSGRVSILELPLHTSPRRWRRNGYIRQTWMNLSTYFLYRLGIPLENLARRYAKDSRAVIMFCKYPEPGQVKTRLAASIGDAEAAHVYRHMVAHTLKSLRRLRAHAKVFVFYAPAEAAEKMKGWLGRGHRYIPQSTGSLGDRMLDAFWFASLEGHGATLIVGTDCPDLRPAQLEQAFSALENHDVVLGPTHDGGYFLIGTTQPQPALFHGIAWSTPSVMSQTLRRAEEAALRAATLDPLRDVDTLEDLQLSTSPTLKIPH